MENKKICKCVKCGLYFSSFGIYTHENKCNLSPSLIEEIRYKYKVKNYSILDVCNEYLINKTLVRKIIGDVEIRKNSDAVKLAHEKYPENFKHSDETKEKLRKIRLKYMSENPEKTAWRLKNMSYPEKIFKEALEIKNFNVNYLIEREYSVFPYFIDFAFINEKLAIEIDGSQHLLLERKLSDEKKDKLLNSKGWKVYRVTANQIKYNTDDVMIEINNILDISDNESDTYIINSKITEYISKTKKYKKQKDDERIENNGLTNKQVISALKQRKVERPTYKQLIIDIANLGYCAAGRKYGVSDNTIRKWKKHYEKRFLK